MRVNPLGGKRSIGCRWMHAAIVVIASIAIGGCTAMAVRTAADYDRGSAATEKLAQDADACAKQAEAHQKEYGLGPYDPTHGSYNWMYDSCMQAGGYQRKKP
jgi:outer membrane murein-binding lipoprotein Lpp